jgi:hypothetical protein
MHTLYLPRPVGNMRDSGVRTLAITWGDLVSSLYHCIQQSPDLPPLPPGAFMRLY